MAITTPQCSVTLRTYSSKSVQLPYGFYTRHLDRMTMAISSEYFKLNSKEGGFCYSVHIANVH